MAYREHKDHANFERTQLMNACTAGGDLQQGIYTMASGGRGFGRMNAGWPDPDGDQILANLKRAVQAYYAMPKSERLLSKTLNKETDKLKWESDSFIKPEGTLDLRVVRRGYAFQGMTSFDQRNPMYFHIDRLWFKPSEWKEFLPSSLTVGSKANVTGPGRTRIALLSYLHPGGSAWWMEHIKGGQTTTEVTAVRGNLVDLKLTARYEMKANFQYNKGSFYGDQIGYMTYDTTARKFTRFEYVTLGVHDVGEMKTNIHVATPTTTVASFAELNPGTDPDDNMIPQQWKWGYGLNWCRTP